MEKVFQQMDTKQVSTDIFNNWKNRFQDKTKTYQSDNAIINIYEANTNPPKFIKEAILQSKSHIGPHTVIVSDISALLLPIDRLSREKLADI